MKVERIEPAFRDERGDITDVLRNTNVDYATIITSKKNAVRANHYHKETYQYLYVMEGRLRVVTQMPGKPIEEATLGKGDMVVNVPMERHAFEALEDSVMLVLTCGPRGGEDYEKDTYRLDVPLIAPRA